MPITDYLPNFMTRHSPVTALVKLGAAAAVGSLFGGRGPTLAALAAQYALLNFRREPYVDAQGAILEFPPEGRRYVAVAPLAMLAWTATVLCIANSLLDDLPPMTLRNPDPQASRMMNAIMIYLVVSDEVMRQAGEAIPLLTGFTQFLIPIYSPLNHFVMAGESLEARHALMRGAIAAMVIAPAVSELLVAPVVEGLAREIRSRLYNSDNPFAQLLGHWLGAQREELDAWAVPDPHEPQREPNF